jgi:hypothetical protein
MAASYSDVLLAKLALQQRAVAADYLRECLNAQEAGRRAGVEQTLGQVLLKRGYVTHAVLRQLEAAREVGERTRRAKLELQLLVRRGRPPEETLRAFYENLRLNGFPAELGTVLANAQQITPEEHAHLRVAVDRAWQALYVREAEELSRLLQNASGVVAPPPLPAPAAAYGYAPAAPAFSPQAAPYGYAPAPPYPPPAAYPPPPFAEPLQRTVERPAFYPPPAAYPAPYAAPPAPPLRPQQLPPSPAPWQQRTAERQAFGWAPAAPAPNAFGPTAERAAHMNLLPEWAATAERRARPEAAPGAPPADAPHFRRKPGALAEPTGPVPGFETIERLARGSIGVVFKATELASGRTVALKVLLPVFLQNPELCERFKREAQVAASLEHPNIRKVHAGGEAGGYLYLAMEYLEGETLQDKIDKQGKLPEGDCLRWIAQAARALDYYQKKGLLHRDLKPENIFVTRDNRALVCELGISKRVYEEYALTLQGTTLGEPFYTSPEQGMGTEEIDIRSDIYSLGITLYHCLTGRVPFVGGNAGVIISKHAREPLPDPRRANPAISRATAALIDRMCAKRPQDRHQSPKELLAELTWIRSETQSNATPIVPLEPPSLEEARAAAAAKPGFWRRLLRAIGMR